MQVSRILNYKEKKQSFGKFFSNDKYSTADTQLPKKYFFLIICMNIIVAPLTRVTDCALCSVLNYKTKL